MNYQQTIDYLFSQLPMFQRIGAAAYKANLDNTYALLKVLGNPHLEFRSIHIAGTNGKGSVSHMIASALQEAGYKTALHTSPHLKDFRERIKINGQEIPKDYVINFVERYKTDFKKIQPSFFEMTVGMAFKYFEEEKVDIAVLETGMGGRLDSTNVVSPELGIITNISLDHTAFLGDSLGKIAAEKAGIIKENTPLVIGETQEETKNIFLAEADKKNAALFFADQNYSARSQKTSNKNNQPFYLLDIYKNDAPFLQQVELPLTGNYQLKNLITAIQAFEVINKGEFKISEKAILGGIKNVKENTGFLGRWQILASDPLCICDTGHNVAGIDQITKQIRGMDYENLHFVLGMVNDKDIENILKLLPKKAKYYFCKADIPRGLDAEILAAKAKHFDLKGKVHPSVSEAFLSAKARANKNDLVFVGGSTFVVAEVV
jgi:dihydrofolate synthase / folylpolyglutamate synthase